MQDKMLSKCLPANENPYCPVAPSLSDWTHVTNRYFETVVPTVKCIFKRCQGHKTWNIARFWRPNFLKIDLLTYSITAPYSPSRAKATGEHNTTHILAKPARDRQSPRSTYAETEARWFATYSSSAVEATGLPPIKTTNQWSPFYISTQSLITISNQYIRHVECHAGEICFTTTQPWHGIKPDPSVRGYINFLGSSKRINIIAPCLLSFF